MADTDAPSLTRDRPSKPARLVDDADVIHTARQAADAIAATAAERDRLFLPPHDAVATLLQLGLTAIGVPRDFGGPDASAQTIAEVIRLLGAADPGVAQILQPHLSVIENARQPGVSPQARTWIFGEAASGALFGNAIVERDTETARTVRTRLTGDAARGYHLDGTKFYSTGALFARWIGITAVDEQDHPLTCMVARDSPGLTVHEDWRAIGQRSSMSGTVTLDHVPVEATSINFDPVSYPAAIPLTHLVHAAIDTGIARAALDDTIRFARERSRAWVEGPVGTTAGEVQVQEMVGHLVIRVEAAEAYLRHAADLTQSAREEPASDKVMAARLAVAGAKSISTDVALAASTDLFAICGTRSTMIDEGLDRHWRNARVHTLHNPDRWIRTHIGAWHLNGTSLPANGKI